MAKQTEFNFGAGSNFETYPPRDGLTSWRQERERAWRELALKLGLPINHRVEVSLKDGVVLRGPLRIGEVVLELEKFDRGRLSLEVDGLVFSYAEVESCVRLD